MGGLRKADGSAKPIAEAVSRIEAALQAGLGAGKARPDLARKALADAPSETDLHVEAWLDSVAAELQSSSAAIVPEEMVDAIAERMVAEPEKSLGAHAKVEDEIILNLVRRP